MAFSSDVGSSAREKFKFFEDNTTYVGAGTSTSPIGVFVGGQYNSSAPTYADGDPAVLQLTSEGRLKCDASLTVEGDIQIGAVELKDAESSTRVKIQSDGTDNALTVMMNSLPSLATGTNAIGTVGITSVITGTGATNLGKAEDAVHTSGDTGVMMLSVKRDTAIALTAVEGKYQPFITDSNGRLYTLDQHTSAIKTAVEIIDNAIYADDADWTDGTSSHALVGGLYQSSPQTVTDGDVAPFQTDSHGNLKTVRTDGTTDETFPTTSAVVSGASAANLLAAGSGSTKHKIFYMILSVDTAGTVTLSDGMGVHYMAANSHVIVDFRPLGFEQTTADTAITVTNGGGGNFSASLTYSTA